MNGVQALLERWTVLIARHSDAPGALDTGRALLDSWSEPHRRYHSVAHLRGILKAVEELADAADDADAVRLAAWYHDAVYNCLPDDEEQSARRAQSDLTDLGVAAPLVDEVGRLVRLTVTHDPQPGDHNGAVLCDADLAALAVPSDDYRRNTAAIRAEYSHIGEDAFRKGRTSVLEGLLAGPAVYRTEAARQRWEAAAQRNLRAELAALAD